MDVGGLKAQQVLQSGTGRSGSMNINALRLVGQRLAPAGHKLGQAAPYISRGLSEGVRVLKPSDVTMRQLLGLGP